MQLTVLISFLAVVSTQALHVLGNPLPGSSRAATLACPGGTVIAETYIGKDKNVKVEYIACASNKAISKRSDLEARQTNVCGANCKTNCFAGGTGGPDPNNCHIIADAIRFDSQAKGALFQIPTGVNNTIAMTFRDCLTFFVNQDFTNLTYCRLDWADVLDFIAPNCQAQQNAHGGNCVATDQRWFIQAQHS
ncbi:hypothetical protein HGRIS_014397 [Hohenbuehelia grisea]|uniref:Uncharacterized protein n=1 Tax=Hohenbuehelia grisea TaxID=104357 RepID=A0ABR3JTD7_9AGAR